MKPHLTLIAALLLLIQTQTPCSAQNQSFLTSFFQSNSTPTTHSPFKAQDSEKLLTLSEELAERLNNHNQLPERSPLGMQWLGDSQSANELSMKELMETLAIELGSSKALGILTLLSENHQQGLELQKLTKSTDPAVEKTAKENLEKIKNEDIVLKASLKETLNKEGLQLSTEDIESLANSPNAHDHTTLIAAFQNCQKISQAMEKRLLAYPSETEAKKYYAVQFILLACLHKIQTGLLEKIQENHIPKTIAIQKEAQKTLDHAQLLLHNSLSESEKQILSANIETCKITQNLAEKTKAKLEKNFEILSLANQKTKQSLQTAQNSHKTVLLRSEITELDLKHSQEFEAIQKLIVPEMIAIRFSNPHGPEILPRLLQKQSVQP